MSLLVPRPRRLRDEKRAMGTRMSAAKPRGEWGEGLQVHRGQTSGHAREISFTRVSLHLKFSEYPFFMVMTGSLHFPKEKYFVSIICSSVLE